MGLTWAEHLSVGNALIDLDHKNLICKVNNVRNAIRARDSFMLKVAFEHLEDGLCIHYANEERIAQAVNFDFSAHKQKQQYTLSELQHLRAELLAKRGIWSDLAVAHFIGFLKTWMIEDHIVRMNMLMKPTLQSHDYTFLPGCEDDKTIHTAG
jgi:hemerythrin-like metal-binding protein